jgi:Family of unknown function (DUF6885)
VLSELGRSASVDERQQKDNLCGPFHAARLLREEAGVTEWDGVPLDQDLVALHAGTLLPDREVGPQVPPGAVNLRDYRFELARADEARVGTTATGLAAALAELSGGRLVVVPVSGGWTAELVERLVVGGRAAGARLIANARTGLLWGSRPPLELLLDALEGRLPADPPAADWDAGHFVELAQLVRGQAGALVVVRDSYPSLGWGGTHLQPPAAVAAALLRGDGRGGGVLAVGGPDEVPGIEELVAELGLATEMWDN